VFPASSSRFLLFCISAFSVPLLCERRVGLVDAVVTSVRIVVFGNFRGHFVGFRAVDRNHRQRRACCPCCR
jgi:uncharacterized membrane protein